MYDAAVLALVWTVYINEMPVASGTLRDSVEKVFRSLKYHGLEPTYRNHRLWRRRYNRDADPRRYPPLRKGQLKHHWQRKPTAYSWNSPINTQYMISLVEKYCRGARRDYMLNVYRHGFPDHYRGPIHISSIRPNHIRPGDEGSQCIDTYIREAVEAKAALVTRVPIFPGTITLPVQVVKKKRLNKPTKYCMCLDGSTGKDTRTGMADWTASEDTRFTSDTTLMRLAELVAYGAAHGNLEDYHQAFRSMRVCTWDVQRSCIHWKGHFVYFGTYGFGKTVTPSHWEGHADLLQREQLFQIRLLERTVLKQSATFAALIGLGSSGLSKKATINRIVDGTLLTTPLHYSEKDNDLIRGAFHRVCDLAGQQRQLAKVVRYATIVAFDGFLLDLTPGHRCAGVPEDKCEMITLLISMALKGIISPDEALSLVGKMEHISSVISNTALLIPAFRACTLAATHRNLPKVNLSPDATADLRRWQHLLSIRTQGGAIWTPLTSLFLVAEPRIRLQTDASGDPQLGVGGFVFIDNKPSFAFAFSWDALYGDTVSTLFSCEVYSTAYIELVGLYIGLKLIRKLVKFTPFELTPFTVRWVTDSEAGFRAWSNRRSFVPVLNYMLKDIGFLLAANSGVCISSWASREYRDSKLADALSRLDASLFLQEAPMFIEVLQDAPFPSIKTGLRKLIS